jgi:hypothetical protein
MRQDRIRVVATSIYVGRSHVWRVGTPMLLGASTGLCLALAGVPPTLESMAAAGLIAGLLIGLAVGVRRRRLWPYRYYADWFLLFGVCLGTGLLLGSGAL